MWSNFGRKKDKVNLADLSLDVRKQMEVFDTDSNGVLTPKEILTVRVKKQTLELETISLIRS